MDDLSGWRAELRQCMFQYNTVVRRTTQSSPFLLFFGGVPNTPVNRKAHAALKYVDEAVNSDADVQAALQDGVEAHRATAAAGGNLQRENTAVALNKTGVPPPGVAVGQPVFYYQEVSGGSEGAQTRPRPAVRSWFPGVVRAIEGVKVTLSRADAPDGATFLRHVSDVAPRPQRVDPFSSSTGNEESGGGVGR
jgi:hypothetical protein